MKWFEQEIKVKELPVDHYVTIIGQMDDNVVHLDVEFYQFSSDSRWTIVEWSKQVKMWQYTDITNDDIRNKYWDKITKIIKKHESMPYHEWHKYFLSKVSTK